MLLFQAADGKHYADPVWTGDKWYIKDLMITVQASKRTTGRSALKFARKVLRDLKLKANVATFYEDNGIFDGKFGRAFSGELILKAPIPVPPQHLTCSDGPDFSDLRFAWCVDFPTYDVWNVVHGNITAPHICNFVLNRYGSNTPFDTKKTRRLILKQWPLLKEMSLDNALETYGQRIEITRK